MLAAALQDYGRLVKTEFVLRYLTRPGERRGIHRQLNKGESINALEDGAFATSGSSTPSPSIRSASRSLRTICSGVCRRLFTSVLLSPIVMDG